MFHSIKEPGAHLDLLFTRHGTPLYGWELEARVFSVCLLIHGITMGLPFLFVLYVAGQMGDMSIPRLWSGGW